MRPEERENQRYSSGSINPVDIEENMLFSFLPEGQGKSLLDIGCGIGTISEILREKGFDVKGVDFSEVGVNKCIEKGLDARTSDVDKDGLEFPDRSFDVVWAGDVIEHVFDPMYLFDEIARVLKDDGVLLATVPNDFFLKRRWRIFITGRSLQSGVYKKLRQCKHHTFFSWDLLLLMLDSSNLEIDRYAAVRRCFRSKKKAVTYNKKIGRLFGRKFIFTAGKASGKGD